MAISDSSPVDRGAGPGKQCNLMLVYLRDVSFEAPKVPGVLFGHKQPQLEFDVTNTYSLCTEASEKLGEVYSVMLHVTVRAMGGDQTLFLIEVQQGGLFEVTGHSEEERDFILRTQAAEMLYPHTRELVGSLVNRAGFPRLLLKPIDFETRYFEAIREYEAALQAAQDNA